jgi:hypothetical protein
MNKSKSTIKGLVFYLFYRLDALLALCVLLVVLGIYLAISVFYNGYWQMAVLAIILIAVFSFLAIKRVKGDLAAAELEADKLATELKKNQSD